VSSLLLDESTDEENTGFPTGFGTLDGNAYTDSMHPNFLARGSEGYKTFRDVIRHRDEKGRVVENLIEPATVLGCLTSGIVTVECD
jgi:hypothetical protein